VEREHIRVTRIALPGEKGTYMLIASVSRAKRLRIGRLGTYDIVPGFYAYVGSAFGPGGLRARLHHHLESVAQPHWHIDYLLDHAEPVEVWYALSDRKLEQDLAAVLEQAPNFSIPIPRFGCSDYRRSRTSHLFYAKRLPSFHGFQRELNQAVGGAARLVRVVGLSACPMSKAGSLVPAGVSQRSRCEVGADRL
jgi:Uri superfamily endonuclease